MVDRQCVQYSFSLLSRAILGNIEYDPGWQNAVDGVAMVGEAHDDPPIWF
jgi:hypothetical protein